MASQNGGHMALEAMATIAAALTRLEVGQLGVARFGEQFELGTVWLLLLLLLLLLLFVLNMLLRTVHALDEPFTSPDSGAQCIRRFSFEAR
jgi:hypothetical protein